VKGGEPGTLARVKFRITRHSGFSPPPDAIDLLWQRLGAKREDASFSRIGTEIRASWGEEMRLSAAREQTAELGRREVFEIVRDVCDEHAELRSDWFAVSPMP
jgi:hypothetical protein